MFKRDKYHVLANESLQSDGNIFCTPKVGNSKFCSDRPSSILQ